MKKRIKKIGIATIILGTVIFILHILSMLTRDRHIVYQTEYVKSSQIPEEMNGYRIAFVTDTHSMKREDYKEVVAELSNQNIDLLLLGGDFTNTGGDPRPAMEELSKLQVLDGIYGVEGNHDNSKLVFAAMKDNGIVPLSNTGVDIKEHFYLAGIADLWNGAPDIEAATKKAEWEDFVILLAHNPDASMLSDTWKTDLILSGHTHGGQITFFGLWAPALWPRTTITDYGQRFMSGWCENEAGTAVYVSKGTGYISSVPRIFARPEVTIFELQSN